MGEATPLNLLNIAAWLISTCSHPRPFCLCLGDWALAPCVNMQRPEQETSRQAMERKRCIYNAQRVQNKQARQIWQAQHVTGSMTSKDKQTNKKARRQTSKQANKEGNNQVKRQTKMVSTRDKCRFGSNVHNFIVLKDG